MSMIPSLGLGTFRLQGRQASDAVKNGLELGYRHIDTAQIYNNEAEVGKAIAESNVPQGDIFVTTKIWVDNLGRGKLITSLKESLSKLRLEQVALTLIHWPSPQDHVAVADYMGQLAEAQQQGLTRLIGISNFTISHMERAIAAVGAPHIATNQIEIHPFLQNHKVVDFARKHGLHLTAYMPLAYGKVMLDETLKQIAQKHYVTPAQVSLAWLMQQGFAVIPSSTKREHLQSNLAAQKLRLDDEDMAAIAKLDRNERMTKPDVAPQWD